MMAGGTTNWASDVSWNPLAMPHIWSESVNSFESYHETNRGDKSKMLSGWGETDPLVLVGYLISNHILSLGTLSDLRTNSRLPFLWQKPLNTLDGRGKPTQFTGFLPTLRLPFPCSAGTFPAFWPLYWGAQGPRSVGKTAEGSLPSHY